MGEQVHATLDDDLYDKVTHEHREKDKSKSQVVNDRVRKGYNGEGPTLGDTLMPIFGQSLFIAGWVVAAFQWFAAGVTIALIGLSFMLGAKVDEYKEKHGVGYLTAFVKVLGA